MREVAIGMKARDRVSGFEGNVGILDYRLDGTVHAVLDGGVKKDGTLQKQHYFWCGQLDDAETGEPLEIPALPDHETELGKKYRDRITGFVGVATHIAYHMSGCIQVALDPPVNAEGEFVTGYYFDDDRLEDAETKELAVSTPAPRGAAWQTPSR